MIIATHDGPFHADDVFGMALLQRVFPDADFIRTRESKRIATAAIVFDVGGVQDIALRRFDHHGQKVEKRASGIIYSALGLLWREYGLQYCDMNEQVWRRIDTVLIESVDADDNGQRIEVANQRNVNRPTLDGLIRIFNPVSNEDYDSQFFAAVALAGSILDRLKVSVGHELAIYDEIISLYEASPRDGYVAVDHYIPVHDLRQLPEDLKYIVCKEKHNRWLVGAVQDSDLFDSLRKPFPRQWGGLSGEAFAKLTGIDDAQSCHRNRFIAVAYTKAAAILLAEKALA